MKPSATYIFAGGGSGGHLFPGIAVAKELRKRDGQSRVMFFGSTRVVESTIVDQYGLEHRSLSVEPLSIMARNPVRFLRNNWQAWRDAQRLLRSIQPTAVIGLGGFASAPVVLAARRQNIPIILLEQNVIPGRTTRWLSRFADLVCVSFEQSRHRLPRARNLVVTGNPVRAEIAALHQGTLSHSQSADPLTSARELLVLGGSQGADSLNDAVLAAVRQTLESIAGWKIVHQTGPRQVDQVRQAYQQLNCAAEVEPFFNDMPSRYSSASLVISRAGATTLAELACAGLAMILLPYPHAANNHQVANAEAYVDSKAALLVQHAATAEATASQLANALKQLVANPERRQTMGVAAKQLAHPDATSRIADVIAGVVNQHRPNS